MHISFLDIAIMVLYLVFTLFIGYYVSKKVNGFEDLPWAADHLDHLLWQQHLEQRIFLHGVWLESRGLCTIQVSLLCGLH